MQGRARNHQVPVKQTARQTSVPINEEKSLSTTKKPQRRVAEETPHGNRLQNEKHSRTQTGAREARNFRANNPRFQSLTHTEATISPDTSTTKQPYKVYYFEPKRKRTRDPKKINECKFLF